MPGRDFGKSEVRLMKLVKLFEPGRIGGMDLKNRLVLAPMGTYSADADGYITQTTIDFYEARARGGVGLIITQSTTILPEARGPGMSWLHDDRFIPGLSRLADAVHRHGAKIAIQLAHHGMALSELTHMMPHPEEIDLVAPSAIPFLRNDVVPREATNKDIQRLTEGFAQAARRAREAGFDAVEFHGAHGHLIGSFLSPWANRRTDEYGGTPEKRARFACEIIGRARQVVGPGFPICLRINGDDCIDGGITLEDTLRQIPLFIQSGADALHVSAAAKEAPEWQFLSYLFPDGALVHLAQAVKEVAGVPVITVGKIGDPVLAEQILRDGKADFVAMGRALLADPELPNKARHGRFDEIRKCIYCCNCLGRYQEKMEFGGNWCTVNPSLSKEREFELKRTASPKKIIVVGGGLAGMEAARTLAERGHRVTLYEKDSELGGQWNIALKQENKRKDYSSLIPYLTRGLDKAGVAVIYNTEVTAELIRETAPDAVVVATGATPLDLAVRGAKGRNVVQAVDVIAGKAPVGERVVIVGGRLVGMEVADSLAWTGRKVSLVTRHKLGGSGSPVTRVLYREIRNSLISRGVAIFPDSPVWEITEKGVYLSHNRELLFLEADTVVLAVGSKPQNELAEKMQHLVPEVHRIGDCVKPRSALEAIREGAEIGRRI